MSKPLCVFACLSAKDAQRHALMQAVLLQISRESDGLDGVLLRTGPKNSGTPSFLGGPQCLILSHPLLS